MEHKRTSDDNYQEWAKMIRKKNYRYTT